MPVRFALIDLQTKTLAGVVDANDPLVACQQHDLASGLTGRGYQMLGGDSGAHAIGEPGYAVHRAAPDMRVDDRDNPAILLAIADGLPRVAVVLVSHEAAEAVAPTSETKSADDNPDSAETKPAAAAEPPNPNVTPSTGSLETTAAPETETKSAETVAAETQTPDAREGG